MRVLIIGGTGLISTGIIRHLLARGAEVTMVNRGRRLSAPQAGRLNEASFDWREIRHIVADRNDFDSFERAVSGQTYDVVIDMILGRPDQAGSDVRAFGRRCGHFIFCSTVCTYGVKIPANVLIDETFSQEPISEYGRNKVAAEKVFLRAHEQGIMPVTIIRPSHTYGPGLPMIDNIETDPVAWDRIERGLPILCAGDGLGLWVSTHRDDVGKLFAHGAMNPKTFGQAYNATRDQVLTSHDYLKQIGSALGKSVKVIFMPAGWIIAHDRNRFKLLEEITQFHGAYDSSKARRDVPEFRCEIDLKDGAAQTLSYIRRQGTWKESVDDQIYDTMVQRALAEKIEPVAL